MSSLEEIAQERQKVSERMARLDAERGKLAEQLSELEIAERVLSRFGKAEPSARRRRGRPAGNVAVAANKRRPTQQPQALSLSEATLHAVRSHGHGVSAGDVLSYLGREFGLKVRPNHLGIALQRHRRAGRLEQRDLLWYSPRSAGQEA